MTWESTKSPGPGELQGFGSTRLRKPGGGHPGR
jgi:hypothetical protein